MFSGRYNAILKCVHQQNKFLIESIRTSLRISTLKINGERATLRRIGPYFLNILKAKTSMQGLTE